MGFSSWLRLGHFRFHRFVPSDFLRLRPVVQDFNHQGCPASAPFDIVSRMSFFSLFISRLLAVVFQTCRFEQWQRSAVAAVQIEPSFLVYLREQFCLSTP